MISLIINNLLLKVCFGYSSVIWFTSVLTPNDSGVSNFVDNMMNAVPSRIAGYLGVLYGLAIVFKKVSEVWKAVQIHKYDVKIIAETLKQKEIETKKLDSK
jgi:hypothetical protein